MLDMDLSYFPKKHKTVPDKGESLFVDVVERMSVFHTSYENIMIFFLVEV